VSVQDTNTCYDGIVTLNIDGKHIHIGLYPSAQEAAVAYKKAALEYHG